MADYTRLFDVMQYQADTHPLQECLNFKVNDEWRSYTTSECVEYVNNVSKGLLKLGVQPGDSIALISYNNRPEWCFLDQGLMQVGAINVPIYPTISPDDFKYIFNHADVKYVFVGDEELAEKVAEIRNDISTLKEMYTFDDVEGFKNWREVLDVGQDVRMTEVEAASNKVRPDDLATIIYTSGTTGLPKGVMLSHNNIISNIKTVIGLLPLKQDNAVLSFLPICHIFERVVTYAYLIASCNIYFGESIDKIGDNIREVKPQFFTAVPRLLEKVYEKIINKGLSLTGVKKKMFFWAVRLGEQYEDQGKSGWYKFQLKLARKLIFSKWQAALGGNVEAIVSGSAPLSAKLNRIFNAAGIMVREGYGLTETSPVLTFTRFNYVDNIYGTVGPVIPGVELKLESDGEILAKGPNIMMGYFKQPEMTAEVMSGSWFHTGDIGTFVNGPNNVPYLKITDRKKELLKTSGGKYVAPSVIEGKFKESLLIEQMMVVGEGKKFVSALIVPSFPNLEEWAKEKNILWGTQEDIVKIDEVIAKYQEIINRMNPNFSHIEQIKKFKLLPHEWTIDSGELTPTMKVKRKVVATMYCDEIDEIYDV